MKWYKHETSAHNDEKMQMLIDRHGVAGYGFYFIILELIAEKIEPHNLTPEIELTISVLKRKTGVYRTNLVIKYVQSLVDLCLISVPSHDDLRIISDNLFTISCPNLLKRLDNWTKRSVVTSERLSLEQDKEQDKEQEQEYFDLFWKEYPKKKSKGSAEKAFKKLPLDADFFKILMGGLASSKKTQQWNKDNGQYIPYPATWIRARGWEDQNETETFTKKESDPWKTAEEI